MIFSELRKEVLSANVALPRAGLVTMHSGNASGVDRASGIILIKPSGMDYESMTAHHLVAVKLDGRRASAGEVPDGIVNELLPSVDTPHHAALYRADPTLGGIVHTHSNYATAWAVHERPIPCALTAIADEFGGEIPCTPYVDNQGEHIVQAILRHRTKAPAILLGRHGVFSFAQSPRAAFKAAVMVEDVAKTLLLASSLGCLESLKPEEIAKWWDRYHTNYGQPC